MLYIQVPAHSVAENPPFFFNNENNISFHKAEKRSFRILKVRVLRLSGSISDDFHRPVQEAGLLDQEPRLRKYGLVSGLICLLLILHNHSGSYLDQSFSEPISYADDDQGAVERAVTTEIQRGLQ